MNFLHLDDSQSIFFSRQLEQIEARMLQTKYPNLEAESLLPNRIQIDPAMDSYTFRLVDSRGEPAPFSGKEDGVPVVNMSAGEQTELMMHWVLGYEFSLDEIRKAARFGMDLNSMGAESVRRILAERLNKVALLGHAPKGIKGLFNLAGTLTHTPNAAWSGATSTQIIDDLCDLADKSLDNTLSIESATRIVLPKGKLRFIERMPMSVDNPMSVLSYFNQVRPNVQVSGANYLDTAGSGATPRAIAYDPAMVGWLVSMPYNQLAPQLAGFNYKVNAEAKAGGVFTQAPSSIAYMDNF